MIAAVHLYVAVVHEYHDHDVVFSLPYLASLHPDNVFRGLGLDLGLDLVVLVLDHYCSAEVFDQEWAKGTHDLVEMVEVEYSVCDDALKGAIDADAEAVLFAEVELGSTQLEQEESYHPADCCRTFLLIFD